MAPATSPRLPGVPLLRHDASGAEYGRWRRALRFACEQKDTWKYCNGAYPMPMPNAHVSQPGLLEERRAWTRREREVKLDILLSLHEQTMAAVFGVGPPLLPPSAVSAKQMMEALHGHFAAAFHFEPYHHAFCHFLNLHVDHFTSVAAFNREFVTTLEDLLDYGQPLSNAQACSAYFSKLGCSQNPWVAHKLAGWHGGAQEPQLVELMAESPPWALVADEALEDSSTTHSDSDVSHHRSSTSSTALTTLAARRPPPPPPPPVDRPLPPLPASTSSSHIVAAMSSLDGNSNNSNSNSNHSNSNTGHTTTTTTTTSDTFRPTLPPRIAPASAPTSAPAPAPALASALAPALTLATKPVLPALQIADLGSSLLPNLAIPWPTSPDHTHRPHSSRASLPSIQPSQQQRQAISKTERRHSELTPRPTLHSLPSSTTSTTSTASHAFNLPLQGTRDSLRPALHHSQNPLGSPSPLLVEPPTPQSEADEELTALPCLQPPPPPPFKTPPSDKDRSKVPTEPSKESMAKEGMDKSMQPAGKKRWKKGTWSVHVDLTRFSSHKGVKEMI